MDLLERDLQLAELADIHRSAAAGRGCVVSVSGAAGTGKTTLVTVFADALPDPRSVRWGWCDDLVVPRPLAPFRDILPQRLDGQTFLDTLADDLCRPSGAAVVVIEDAQWADEATLEAIRFLGRRIERRPIMLVITHRSDDVPDHHPLRVTLGSLPADGLRRLEVGPLSPDAVTALAGSAEEADRLYRLTAGNPFYLHEMLAAPDAWVPDGVQDAVAARLARLDAVARHTVEALAPVPGRVERWLTIACDADAGVEDAVRSGFLVADTDTVRFGHELTRRAVLRSLDRARRRHYDARILDALREVDDQRQVDPARFVHHAIAAEDVTAIAHYAPMAAQRAAAVHAHREAARHLGLALDHPEQFTGPQLADLYDLYADECELTEIRDTAAAAAARAVELREHLGADDALAASLYRLAYLHWGLGQGRDARRGVDRAVALVEGRPPSQAQVKVFALRAKLAMVDYRFDEAVAWGTRAIEAARTIGDDHGRAHAAVTVGTARWQRDPDDDAALIDALSLALSVNDVYAAARAYVNLAEGYTRRMRDELGRAYAEDGLAHCREHDIVTAGDYLVALIASCDLRQGRWDDAETAARYASDAATEALARLVATCTVATVEIRRGDPRATETLADLVAMGEAADDTQSLIPVHLLRAEHAFLRGDLDDVAKIGSPLLDLAVNTHDPVWIGQAALWMHRVGRLDAVPDYTAEPYALHIRGRVTEAAQRWEALGRPYEQADALADSDDPDDVRAALRILDGVGATAKAHQVRVRLTDLGVRSVPRGPRPSTRANPAGLTERQVDVLELLAADLTYREIADRLHLSVKTIDHHVSAVRTKLDVDTRHAAVAEARRRGILAPTRRRSPDAPLT